MSPDTLKLLAAPFLNGIRGQMTETYGISVFDEARLKSVVLESITGRDYVCFSIAPGTATPVYTSAPGKAFFAHLPEKQRQRLLPRIRFRKFTPHTLTTRRSFEVALERIRKQGYATDLSEETQGCHCGGVVVLDPEKRPVAALWISGMAKRLPKTKLVSLIRALQKTAKQIEKELAAQLARPHIENRFSASVKAALTLFKYRIRQPVKHEELARLCRVSYSTLRTAFLRETGMTPGQYQLSLRLKEAQRLLTDGTDPITAIAEQTGFCNQKHFSMIFKRKRGLSPLAYRRRLSTPACGSLSPYGR
jgi:DNA-binding IclR family transcriptional regulator